MAKKRRPVWLVLALLAACFYLGGCVLARVASEGMLFAPPPPTYGDLPGLVKIPGRETGREIAAVFLPNPGAKHLVIFFHGNGDDLGPTMPRLRALHSLGLAVLAVDYPGYGQTGGRPSEDGFNASADAAFDYAAGRLGWPKEAIVAHGVSLGGAGAMRVASREKIGGLILESAFLSAYRVMTKYPLLPGDRMNNLARMKTVRCPVFVIHGTTDKLVELYHGEKLFAAAPEPKRKYWVQGASHNHVLSIGGDRYWQELREFYASLPAAQP